MFFPARYLFALCSILLLFTPVTLPAAESPAAPSNPPETQSPVATPVSSEALPKAENQPVATPARLVPLPSTIVTLPDIKPQSSQPRGIAPFTPNKLLASGQIAEDTAWSGSVLLEGMVTVANQATLTIQPGTVIRCAANSGILVLGRLVAKGTVDSPLLISSVYAAPAPSDWNGIVLAGTEKKNILEHIRIEGADTALQASFAAFSAASLWIEHVATGIRLLNSVASVHDAELVSYTSGIIALKSDLELDKVLFSRGRKGLSASSSSVSAVNTTFTAHADTALQADKSQLKIDRGAFFANQTGVKMSGCDGTIVNSKFNANFDTGVVFSGSLIRFNGNIVTGNKVGLQCDDNQASLWGNSITENSSYNLMYLGDEWFYAGANWFGRLGPGGVEKTVFSNRSGALQLAPLLQSEPLPAIELDTLKVRN